jgi:hypothetical protein
LRFVLKAAALSGLAVGFSACGAGLWTTTTTTLFASFLDGRPATCEAVTAQPPRRAEGQLEGTALTSRREIGRRL